MAQRLHASCRLLRPAAAILLAAAAIAAAGCDGSELERLRQRAAAAEERAAIAEKERTQADRSALDCERRLADSQRALADAQKQRDEAVVRAESVSAETARIMREFEGRISAAGGANPGAGGGVPGVGAANVAAGTANATVAGVDGELLVLEIRREGAIYALEQVRRTPAGALVRHGTRTRLHAGGSVAMTVRYDNGRIADQRLIAVDEKGDRLLEGEVRDQRPDGEWVWSLAGTPIGRESWSRGVLTDISLRTRDGAWTTPDPAQRALWLNDRRSWFASMPELLREAPEAPARSEPAPARR
ncbi:MAG: hypothetical protein ACK5XO_06835 [Phycisphaerales bacterium]|jgi:hypothetical protein